MKIQVNLDPECKELEVTIRTNELTDEVNQLVDALKGGNLKRIIGIHEHKFHVLRYEDIYFFFSTNRKVYAQTQKGPLEVKLRLYELEILLKRDSFVRFSKSTIANLKHVESFELSFNGNLCAHFPNGLKEYISRKYVPNIKDALNMEGVR